MSSADEDGWFSGWSLPSVFRPEWYHGLSRSIRFLCSAIWIFITFKLSSDMLGSRSSSPEDERKRPSQTNRRCAERALELVLQLKGYYIKAAQTLCGAGMFPEEFDGVFAVLLDNCPSEPFQVVRDIVEEELRRPLHEVFADFAEAPVAAASIGQVHMASLLDGTPVAVKVQYPEVEKYFRMDVRTVAFVLWLTGMGEQVREIFNRFEEQMVAEFDYTSEAALMREVAQNILPRYDGKIAIPLPIDAAHPACADAGLPPVCSRKVLTMERLSGTCIRTHTQQLLELFARYNGTTIEELKKQQRRAFAGQLDNEAVKKALRMGAVSECTHVAAIAAVRVRNAVARLGACCICSCFCPAQAAELRIGRAARAVPLNGPRISRLIFDVHGHEIFENGLFNSDPHAGNVLMLEDGRLGLIDYGAVMRLSEEQRLGFARLVVAIADEDDEAAAQSMFALGFRCKNSDWRLALLMAHVSFNRGPYHYDMNRIAPKIGMPIDADIMVLDQYIRGGMLDEIQEFPLHMIMLQRCCMVLSGICFELGAGRLSAAGMFRAEAARCLQAQEVTQMPP